MGKQVWFGTENYMSWIPAPVPGVTRSLSKWRASAQYLNGGQWRRESASGSRLVSLQWPIMTSAEVRQITAFLEGTYGAGPFYYSDPFAEGANVLPQWLAVPWLATDDAPLLYGTSKPTIATTPANTYAHPSYGAVYAVSGASISYTFPVPPNTTAYFGWRGAVTGSAVLKANTTTVAPLAVTGGTLTNFTYTAPSTGGWVTLAVSGAGTLTAYSLHLSFGTAAPTGNFVKGEGFTALRLDGDPDITGYSAVTGVLDRQAVTANFVEVGAWE